ncbi:MAG: YkgJ family cysteine cluster protein [Candidatus Methanoperedens sp.]|nr:YkgJ family cysteine cluster protein [Candidatus Methanoperedens sp.]
MKKETSRLKISLDEAVGIDESEIADKIMSIGYKCQKCARCCMGDFGDNTVSIFPFEIRRISEKTGLQLKDIAIPTPSDDRDDAGNIHTFEWILKKKGVTKNGDCTFLDKGLCKIYECRSYICRTYPFYLLDGRIMISECEGLGNTISNEDAMKMAKTLKERYIAEIRESIALLEKFHGFAPSGKGNICVHDSEGEHWLEE